MIESVLSLNMSPNPQRFSNTDQDSGVKVVSDHPKVGGSQTTPVLTSSNLLFDLGNVAFRKSVLLCTTQHVKLGVLKVILVRDVLNTSSEN